MDTPQTCLELEQYLRTRRQPFFKIKTEGGRVKVLSHHLKQLKKNGGTEENFQKLSLAFYSDINDRAFLNYCRNTFEELK